MEKKIKKSHKKKEAKSKKIKHGDHYHRTHEAKKNCKKIKHGRQKTKEEKCKIKKKKSKGGREKEERKYYSDYIIPKLSQRHLNFLNALASQHNAYSLGGYSKPRAQDMTSQLNLLGKFASQTKNIFS
jgi:hypothetical protein